MIQTTRTASVMCAAIHWGIVSLACTTVLQVVDASERGDTSKPAQRILNASDVTGGLIVHLGCGDGQLTAALRASDSFVVQGLDADARNVEAARQHIQSRGLYGSVSVRQWSAERLPYVDNLVSLVVRDTGCTIRDEEITRVLAPGGVAIKLDPETRNLKPESLFRKPWPEEIDEWQQHFHDADNNAVAHDSVVGPPRHFQWIAELQWSRAHLVLPSIHSMVSSQGRLFTIEDQASAEHPALPGKFALVARDAFNGVLLWQRPFPDWQPVNVYIKYTPAQLQRRLAAVGETVYCTPGLNAPVTALDAVTGKTLKVYEGTERTQEFAFDRDVLFLVIGDPTDTEGIGANPGGGLGSSQFSARRYGPEIPKLANPTSSIVALAANSGEKLWEKSGDDTAGYQGTSLAIRGEYAAYCTDNAVVCLDRKTGRQLWRVLVTYAKPRQPGMSAALVLSDDAVYSADAKSLTAYSLEDGAKMWTAGAKLNHYKAADVFLAGGVVWSAYYNGHDPQTGEIVKTLSQQMMGPMGHDRCYRNRITDRYYINTKTGGSDFLGLDDAREFPHPWARSTCGIGHLPCNGLLYLGPPACSCCNWVMLNAMNALAPEPGLKSSSQPIDVETSVRLEKGPAFGAVSDQQSAVSEDVWPTYRHDAGRTGVTKTAVPAKLKPCWETKLSTRSSAPVIAAGNVFVADVDAHAVCALDATNGREVWRYTTGSRVDSPPTYYKGLLLFGSRDGWAYCLRASDGELAWRFRDLPDKTICAYGQLESVWPVCGSILVNDGVAYFAAGRNSFMDGGIFLYGLDPQTGRVIHRRQMHGPYGDDGFPIINSQITSGNGIEGFKNDIFLTDGQLLYLRQQAFQPDLTPLKSEEVTRPHLIPSAGFLETIPHHRTFWTIDTTIRYDIATSRGAAHGDILVMDGNRFYEVRGYRPGRTGGFDPRPNGYTLFAGTYSKRAPAATPEKKPKTSAADAPRGKKKKTSAANRRKKRNPPAVISSQIWSSNIPLTGKAMVLADDVLFVAGTPAVFPADDLSQAYEGRMGGVLWAASAETGEKMAEYKLDAAPAWDSLAVADGRLYIVLKDGRVICMSGK
ncbi:MAG: PQQ-binding-like beta-propeller repeat protein [Planctomycetes bacterium]|nr:PQQ-binding-like beta-propeller repeat protein [Planctomycetota bacterium]MBL7042097.1 PQQ-binding-like beta-propeller repeat protein [Pirellulaceae bacterium]